MRVIKTTAELRAWRESQQSRSVGFVPTMGALHLGHAELLKKSVLENELTILSVFINPTQFNNKEDFEKYPVTFAEDQKLAQECGVNCLFFPEAKEMYPHGYDLQIDEKNFSQKMEGQHRPGHFSGMLTIVMKLLMLANSTRAYFGEKDYQQLKLVEKLVNEFFLKTTIIPVQTVREESGLAMSSRNRRLSESDRRKAAMIYKAITSEPTAERAKEVLVRNGFDVDYVEDHELRRYVAATLEGVRLIDNVELPGRKH